MAGTLLAASNARADVSPAGCLSNSVDLTVSKDHLLVRNGDVVNYTVSATNTAGTPCDLTNVTITLTLPAANGSATGTVVPLPAPPGRAIKGGTGTFVVGTVPWTVALNPGVSVATVKAEATGDLHDVAVGLDNADVLKTLGTGAIQPAISVTKAASTAGGQAPLDVTYTYSVKNISSTPETLNNIVVNDDLCRPVTYVSGDSNGNGLLEVGETFVFTCTSHFAAAGTYTNHATACGNDTNPMDTRQVCAGPVQATVIVSAPPSPPPPANVPVVNASVPNKAASTPSTCFSVPKTLKLRARETTTVKVSVTTGTLKGAKITIKGPGFTKHSTTNSKGVTTFTVKPSKSGTLTVTSDRCLQVAKASVKAAHQTQSKQLPKNTG